MAGQETCGAQVRGGGTCTLDPGHRGFHATVTFYCDACGKARRGRPHATTRDGEYRDGLHFCFLCVRADEAQAERDRQFEDDHFIYMEIR